MFSSLFRGVRLIFLIWIALVILAIALGFVHQAHRHSNRAPAVRQERVQ